MPATKDDLRLLLEIDRTLAPRREAKKFVWTEATQQGEGFFERYGWDSDERYHVNEYSTYFEFCGMAWRRGLIDEELLLEWVSAAIAWQRVGPVLREARRMLKIDDLWTNFEALAKEQERRSSPS